MAAGQNLRRPDRNRQRCACDRSCRESPAIHLLGGGMRGRARLQSQLEAGAALSALVERVDLTDAERSRLA